METLQYEIIDISKNNNEIKLELRIEGLYITTANASEDVLKTMKEQLGLDRDRVAFELKLSLEEFLKHRLPRIKISEPKEDLPNFPLKFVSSYVYNDGNTIQTGSVWYDMAEGNSGPDSVDSLIQSYMRREVHRKLTEPNSIARKLVG